MKLQKAKKYNAGDGIPTESEPFIEEIKFNIKKFSIRKRPDKKDIIIFPMFAEFGCETLAVVYCLPEILAQFPGRYFIAMGWYGREYLYKHLVDEFWEIDESLMFLRDYCRAFHHVSKNLKRAEKKSKETGRLIEAGQISNLAVFPVLNNCPNCQNNIYVMELGQRCKKCKITYPNPGYFTDIQKSKKRARWIPFPSKESMDWADSILPENPVGITARNRKTWGRNLDPVFYERLIFLLEDLGFNPVWMGEKVTSLPCPFKRIPVIPESDLEKTFAAVSKMKFTIQYYTASTRLAGLIGTPFVIFESPDQIWGQGQEGMRLNLLSKGNKKLVISHYKLANNNHNKLLELSENAILELLEGNVNDMIGMVKNEDYVEFWKQSSKGKLGER